MIAVLEVAGVTKSFGTVRALERCTFSAAAPAVCLEPIRAGRARAATCGVSSGPAETWSTIPGKPGGQ